MCNQNGWYIKAEGYMTAKPAYQMVTPMKACRAIEHGHSVTFVHIMGGAEEDSRTYVTKEYADELRELASLAYSAILHSDAHQLTLDEFEVIESMANNLGIEG
jgi:hypothetical protein